MDSNLQQYLLDGMTPLQYGGKWREISEVLSCGRSSSESYCMESAGQILGKQNSPQVTVSTV